MNGNKPNCGSINFYTIFLGTSKQLLVLLKFTNFLSSIFEINAILIDALRDNINSPLRKSLTPFGESINNLLGIDPSKNPL